MSHVLRRSSCVVGLFLVAACGVAPVDDKSGGVDQRGIAADSPSAPASPERRCQARPPSDIDRQWAKEAVDEVAPTWTNYSRVKKDPESKTAVRSITISVVFHVLSNHEGVGNLARSRITRQMDVLNAAYAGTPFQFKLESVNPVVNDAWYDVTKEYEPIVSKALHKGTAQTLNVITATFDDILGTSRYPWEFRESPEEDAVIVYCGTFPAGDPAEADGCKPDADSETKFEGDTLVHEVGHWLGLFHTFENGCHGEGDGLVSTPAEDTEAKGCPVGRDTCEDKPGLDPIENYMDYSNDQCMTTFTYGQIGRMDIMWHKYRARH